MMRSEDTKFQPGDLIQQISAETIEILSVGFGQPGTDQTEHHVDIFPGDTFLVLTGWVALGLVGFRQMWSFRLKRPIWVNEVFGCFLFEKIA